MSGIQGYAATNGIVSPRISIGIPVYNGERFVRSALESMRSQTFEDTEIIVSDNASTDATVSICEEYVQRDPRIRLFRQASNIGAPANWSFVARQARGTFFKWASANDWCAPTALERCLAALESDRTAVLAQATSCLVDEDSGDQEVYGHDLALLMERPSERLAALLERLALNNGQSGLIRMAALRRTGLDRPYANGDLVLMAELALQGKFIVLPDVLFYRRMGHTTLSRGLEGDEARAFFDPTARGSAAQGRLQLHLDLLRSIVTAAIPTRDKLASLTLALKYMRWDRAAVLSEMKARWMSW